MDADKSNPRLSKSLSQVGGQRSRRPSREGTEGAILHQARNHTRIRTGEVATGDASMMASLVIERLAVEMAVGQWQVNDRAVLPLSGGRHGNIDRRAHPQQNLGPEFGQRQRHQKRAQPKFVVGADKKTSRTEGGQRGQSELNHDEEAVGESNG